MMKWNKIALTSDQVAKGQGQRLKTEFQEIYSEEEEPEEMALFSGEGEEGGRNFYLSPGAAKYCLILLSYYSGARCEAPPFEAVKLELGAADAKETMIGKPA